MCEESPLNIGFRMKTLAETFWSRGLSQIHFPTGAVVTEKIIPMYRKVSSHKPVFVTSNHCSCKTTGESDFSMIHHDLFPVSRRAALASLIHTDEL